MAYEGMENELALTSIPTSLFVNRDGMIVLPPIVGADPDSYVRMFDALLNFAAPAKKTVATEAPKAAASANGKQFYRVIVTDGDGAPVKGAIVQFCDESSCMIGETDDEGIVTYPDVAEGYTYIAHILKAPEGYEITDEEYTAMESYCDVPIVIRKIK